MNGRRMTHGTFRLMYSETQTSSAGLPFGLPGIVDLERAAGRSGCVQDRRARGWGIPRGQWGLSGRDLAAMGLLDANGGLTDLPAGIDRVETFILTRGCPPRRSIPPAPTGLSLYGRARFPSPVPGSCRNRTARSGSSVHPQTGDGLVTIRHLRSHRSAENTRRPICATSRWSKQSTSRLSQAGALFNPLWLEGDRRRPRGCASFGFGRRPTKSTIRSWSERPTVDSYS